MDKYLNLAEKLQLCAGFARTKNSGMLWDAGAYIRRLVSENKKLRESVAQLDRKSNQDDETIIWQAETIAKHLNRIAELENQFSTVETAIDSYEAAWRATELLNQQLYKNAKTADGVYVKPGDWVWVRGSTGWKETKVLQPVTSYMLFNTNIKVRDSYAKKPV